MTLHAISPALGGTWDRASPRERTLVVVAAVLVVAAALWTWVWLPLQSDLARLERDGPRDRLLLGAARAQADDLVATQRAVAAAPAADPRAAVERILAERGLRSTVGTLDLQDRRVRIGFPAVRFDALVGFLDALASREGLRVVDATLTTRVEPGTVRADLVLAR